MDYRLPRSILPRSYEVEIQPNLDDHTFTGRVCISAEVIEPTDVFVCNVLELDLDNVEVDGVPCTFSLDEQNEQLRVELGAQREPGTIEFTANFAGALNDSLKGFYRSSFTDDDGTEHTIATTQFQSTDARRAFPCFDEPDMKATFAVTLVIDPQYTAVSNGAETDRTTRDDGLVAVTFAETMAMSTYLVAFVVGPLVISEPAYAGNVPVRIVHRPGQEHLTQFALDVAVAALTYFEEYYAIPYPTDKLDMIALPDFAMGAMENLGCVTYREILLLVDPDTATQPELQNVADVVNHELAHMWFGDLVTMSWWNGIWLNEAFATFMEMRATDNFRPEWQRWTSFGISRSAAFDIDSLESTRPIEFPVVSPQDAEGMFDLLTYEKGAAVVRMLEQWLGEEVFRDGIRHYLQTHLYGNTETHDLWNALEHVAGKPVTSAMETWIFQGGYPLIEIDETHAHQRRFTYTGESSSAKWSVPLQLRHDDDSVSLVELDGQSVELAETSDHFESFNHAGFGFYRVKLPGERLAALGKSGVDHLESVERFGLVDDAWSLTLANETSIADFLALLNGYRDELDISVWQRIIGGLGFINHVAADADRPALGAFVNELIAPPRSRLGDAPEGPESDRMAQLRGALFSATGTLTAEGSPERTAAIERARSILADPNPDPELRSGAVKIIAANGTADDFATFRSGFENAADPQAEIRNLYALPGFPGKEQVREVTTMALDGTIRTQNAPFVLAQAMMNRSHGSLAWTEVRESWDKVNELFPANTIVRMLTGIRWLTSPDVSGEVTSFFAGKDLPQGQKQLDQHLERLAVNTSFGTRVVAELAEAL